MFESNLANLTAQYQQAYLVYCYKVMQYLQALAWLAEQQKAQKHHNIEPVKEKTASEIKKIAPHQSQEKLKLKSLKHQEKLDISTIATSGYVKARLYDPELGTMLQADTIIPNGHATQSLNRYAYVFNNPLSYTDPSGHVPQEGGYTAAIITDTGGNKFVVKVTPEQLSKMQDAIQKNGNTKVVIDGVQSGVFGAMSTAVSKVENLANPSVFNKYTETSIQERVNTRFNVDSRVNGSISGSPELHGFSWLWNVMATEGFGNEIASFRDDRTNPFNGNIVSEGEAFDNRFIGILTLGIGNRYKATVNIASKASKVTKGGDVGGLLIGKMDDVGKSTGWRKGDHTLNLPSLPPGSQRWAQNAKELQNAINKGKPIRDVSPSKGGGFLDRERALLQENGWKFNKDTSLWSSGK